MLKQIPGILDWIEGCYQYNMCSYFVTLSGRNTDFNKTQYPYLVMIGNGSHCECEIHDRSHISGNSWNVMVQRVAVWGSDGMIYISIHEENASRWAYILVRMVQFGWRWYESGVDMIFFSFSLWKQLPAVTALKYNLNLKENESKDVNMPNANLFSFFLFFLLSMFSPFAVRSSGKRSCDEHLSSSFHFCDLKIMKKSQFCLKCLRAL